MTRTIYLKIYREHFGSIPKDFNGRTCDIHHIDGNHSNNCIENLKAVTLQEHFNIHKAQGDWGACQAIACRMSQSPEVRSQIISELMTKSNAERLAKGIHHFKNSKWQSDNARQQYKEGRHPCQRKYVCSYCGKVGNGPIMIKNHYCKLNPKSHSRFKPQSI